MNAKINITYRDKDNNIIVDPKEGDIAMSPETQKLYTYKDGQWEMIKGESSLGVTMYDLNKQLISQLPVLDKDAIITARKEAQRFINDTNNYYYMLLAREMNYYTIFHIPSIPSEPICPIIDELWGCVEYMGEIKAADVNNGAIEFWVQSQEEGSEPIFMMFFPYDAGVIECIR